MTAEDEVVVRDAPERNRYELYVGDERAGYATYRRVDDRIVIPHTEVDPAFEGRGLGSRLARFALDDVRARGLKVVPACEFIEVYIRRHPEYQDLVAE
jgi:hypothetical protein